MSELTQGAFAEQLNTTFRIAVQGQEPIELKLVHVSELNVNFGTEAFSIIFVGPKEFFLTQATYGLEHEAMGTVHIMLVPIGRDEEGIRYEAVFNRLINKK